MLFITSTTYKRFLHWLSKHLISTYPSANLRCPRNLGSISSSQSAIHSTHAEFPLLKCLDIGESGFASSLCSGSRLCSETFPASSSLQEVLKIGSGFSPETVRRFWRSSALDAGDFLEILVGFGPDADSRKVGFLWKMFRWVEEQRSGFTHLPRSYELMISMLAKAQMLGDAQWLLSSVEARNIHIEKSKLYSEIIQGLAEAYNLEGSVAAFNQAGDLGLVLSTTCYQSLLSLSFRVKNCELVLRVYREMLEHGFACEVQSCFFDFAVKELSENGRIFEVVKIIRRARDLGVEASPSILTLIAEDYCRKKDFDDMLNFLLEWKHIPEARVSNKILSSLCIELGTEEAWFFVQRMEDLGFILDPTTFGILISGSCREGKIRNAFFYLSECFSRNVKPAVHAYNALIGGVFKEGFHGHAKDVFDDMINKEISPDLSTFKVLLAGYCKYKKFTEAKEVLDVMIGRGFISLSPLEEPLSKVFALLGLKHLQVKVKRVNDQSLRNAEFFDSLGNGLYLETDIHMYERALAELLDNAAIPDFDSALIKACNQEDVKDALNVISEIVQWGRTPSLASFSVLLRHLCKSPSGLKEALHLTEEMAELTSQLDCGSINLFLTSVIKNGLGSIGVKTFDVLLHKPMLIENDMWIDLLRTLCLEKNICGLKECMRLAQGKLFLLRFKDIMELINCLCRSGMIHDALQFSACMIELYPDLITQISNAFIKELCLAGFTSLGCLLVEKFLDMGLAVGDEVYVTLIKGFLKEEKLAEALGLIDILLEKNIGCKGIYEPILSTLLWFSLVEKAVTLKDSFLNKHFETDSFIYCTLVTQLYEIGKIEVAAIQLREMLAKTLFPDNTCLNAMIGGYSKISNFVKAREILCIMLRIHADLSISGYRSMVRQMCMQNKITEALYLTKLIHHQDGTWSLMFHNILIWSLFRTGKGSHVKDLLKEMQEKQLLPDRVTFDFLIYGYSKSGNTTDMIHALSTMILKGQKPSSRSFRNGLRYLCNQGKLDEALHLSKLMESSGMSHVSTVHIELAVALISSGRIHEAKVFLKQMEGKKTGIRCINYDMMIEKFYKYRRIETTVDLLNVMLKSGALPNESCYNAIVQGLFLVKDFDHALDFLAEMQQKNLEPSLKVCNALIHGLSVNGRTSEAEWLLRNMVQTGPAPTYNMYRCILDRYNAEGNLEKTSKLMQEMQENGYLPDFYTHWSLVRNLSSYSGDPDIGKGFLSRLLSGSCFQMKAATNVSVSNYLSLSH